jgi:hypothetical protein
MLQGRTGSVPTRPAKNLTTSGGGSPLPTYSTDQSKFGGGSLRFNSASNSMFTIEPGQFSWAAAGYATGVNGGLEFGATGEFTIESFIYRITDTGEAEWFEAGSGGLSIGFRSGTGMWVGQSQVTYGIDTFSGATTGSWQHFCTTRDSSNVVRIYIDGVYKAQGASANYTGTATLGSRANPQVGFQAGGVWLNAYMNEFRISNINRYPVANTANITVPTAPFVNDANTLILIHGTAGLNDDNS